MLIEERIAETVRAAVKAKHQREGRRSMVLPPRVGPGTKLKSLIAPLGFPTCGACNAMLVKMDAGGPDWCVAHKQEIVDAVLARAKATNALRDLSRIGGTEKDAAEFIGNLVDEAIRQARSLQPVKVRQVNNGLGDALLGLCAVMGLQAENPDRQFAYGAVKHSIAFTSLFDHSLGLLRNSRGEWHGQIDGFYDFRCKSDPHWSRIARYCISLGVRHAAMPMLRDRDGLARLTADCAGAYVVAPFVASDGSRDREYPRNKSRQLYDLLRGRGHRVIVLHDDSNDLGDFDGCEVWLSRPAKEVVSLMVNAACVIGGDSGLTHLSGMLGVPTVVLSGSFDARKIHDFYHRCYHIHGTLSCDGCFRQRPFDRIKCGQGGCASLATVPVEDIVDAAERAVKLHGSKVRVVSWHSPAYQQLADVTWPTKQRWAERHGCESYVRRCNQMDGWRQISWWREQLRLMRHGQWLWSIGADAAITGDGEPPTDDACDVVIALDGYGINSDSILLRNAPATLELLAGMEHLRGGCANEQEAMACALSNCEQYATFRVRLGIGLRADGRPASDEMYDRCRRLFTRHRAKLVPQRELNAYDVPSYGHGDKWAGQSWHRGDLVLHVPGKPLNTRLDVLKNAIK